jgi:putative transposase
MAVRRHLYGQGPFGGDMIGPNPTDRAKAGTKRSILVEADGGPLSIVVSGANVHDTKLLRKTLEAVVVERPVPTEETPQHLCLDKAYDNPTGHGTVAEYDYQPHIRRIGEEKLDDAGEKRHPARRWVVERTWAWLSKCRAILVRYDKKARNYLALLQLACALIWYRRWWRLRVLR